MTPASLDELLQAWEADALNGLAHAHGVEFTSEVAEYISTLQSRAQMLIAVVRHLQVELGDIAMSDCSNYVKKIADNALAEAERILKG